MRRLVPGRDRTDQIVPRDEGQDPGRDLGDPVDPDERGAVVTRDRLQVCPDEGRGVVHNLVGSVDEQRRQPAPGPGQEPGDIGLEVPRVVIVRVLAPHELQQRRGRHCLHRQGFAEKPCPQRVREQEVRQGQPVQSAAGAVGQVRGEVDVQDVEGVGFLQQLVAQRVYERPHHLAHVEILLAGSPGPSERFRALPHGRDERGGDPGGGGDIVVEHRSGDGHPHGGARVAAEDEAAEVAVATGVGQPRDQNRRRGVHELIGAQAREQLDAGVGSVDVDRSEREVGDRVGGDVAVQERVLALRHLEDGAEVVDRGPDPVAREVLEPVDVREEGSFDVQVGARPVGGQLPAGAERVDGLVVEEVPGEIGVRTQDRHRARVAGGERADLEGEQCRLGVVTAAQCRAQGKACSGPGDVPGLEFVCAAGQRRVRQGEFDEVVEQFRLEEELRNDARHVRRGRREREDGADEVAQPGRVRSVDCAEPGLGGFVPEQHGGRGGVQAAAKGDGEAADGVDRYLGDRGEVVERDYRAQDGQCLAESVKFCRLQVALLGDAADLLGEQIVQHRARGVAGDTDSLQS